MPTQKDRLWIAIRGAGFESPTDAWRANQRAMTGVGQDLIISNANGNRPISKKAAAVYARVFGRTAGWYLFGDSPATTERAESPVYPPVEPGDRKALRRLFNQVKGLKPDNIKVLLASVEGFWLVNGELSLPSQHHDQSEPANLPRE